jgi:type IV pilus assembly protein PilE
MMKGKIHKPQGFTLVELLITVAIVAILATIALPSYFDFLQKSRRADAHSALTKLQLEQENLRSNCRFYAQGIGANNSCPDTATDSSTVTVQGNTTSRDGYYTIGIEAGSADGNSFTLVATPVAGGPQAADTSCASIKLTVDNTNPNGLKTPTDCWE